MLISLIFPISAEESEKSLFFDNLKQKEVLVFTPSDISKQINQTIDQASIVPNNLKEKVKNPVNVIVSSIVESIKNTTKNTTTSLLQNNKISLEEYKTIQSLMKRVCIYFAGPPMCFDVPFDPFK